VSNNMQIILAILHVENVVSRRARWDTRVQTREESLSERDTERINEQERGGKGGRGRA